MSSMATIRLAIQRAMDKKGVGKKPLAKSANLGETVVRDILNGKTKDVQVGTLVKLAGALDCTLDDLIGAEQVPIVGRIGAGGSIIFEDLGADQTVPRPPAISQPVVALEVRGDSMMPKYADGDVVFISRDHDGVLPEYIGQDCAVRLKGGETFLKRIAYGSQPGLFTLQSLNAADITDVEIEWATPVRFIMPFLSRSL